jgi:hypothetical protein
LVVELTAELWGYEPTGRVAITCWATAEKDAVTTANIKTNWTTRRIISFLPMCNRLGDPLLNRVEGCRSSGDAHLLTKLLVPAVTSLYLEFRSKSLRSYRPAIDHPATK